MKPGNITWDLAFSVIVVAADGPPPLRLKA